MEALAVFISSTVSVHRPAVKVGGEAAEEQGSDEDTFMKTETK